MSNSNGFRILTLVISTCVAVWLHAILGLPSGYVFIFLVASSYLAVVGPMAYEKVPRDSYCPTCKSKVKKREKFCTQCGTSLAEFLSGSQTIQAYRPPPQQLQPVEEAPKPKLPTVMIEGIGYPVLPVLMIDAKTLDALKKATKKKRRKR